MKKLELLLVGLGAAVLLSPKAKAAASPGATQLEINLGPSGLPINPTIPNFDPYKQGDQLNAYNAMATQLPVRKFSMGGIEEVWDPDGTYYKFINGVRVA